MTKFLFTFWISLFFVLGAGAQSKDVCFMDYPAITPDGTTIFFSYESDIWKVDTEGGIAARVTGMDGRETHPSVSPDGKWLAFTANQYGNPDVYVMPLEGGEVQRLTWHDSEDLVSSWSWDSQWIYFRSDRMNRMNTYKVAIEGGTPKRLFNIHFFHNIHNLVEHPQTGAYFFNESWESSRFIHRKGYKGAYNPNIKSFDPKKEEYREWTSYNGKDFMPVFDRTGKMYFLSDEYNGEYNLYTFTKDGEKKRLTDSESSLYFPSVSANGEKVVVRKDYSLHVYDVRSGKLNAIPVQMYANSTLDQYQDFELGGHITSFDVSEDGKKIAMISRGELLVSDVEGKYVRKLDKAFPGRALEVYWMADDRSLLFNQTSENGYQNWCIIPADGSKPETFITQDDQNNRLLAFNSDKSKAVYLSGREEVRLLDMQSRKSEVLTKDELWGYYNDRPDFSPDDRYVSFTAYRDNERDIMVYDLQEKSTMNLTGTAVSEMDPVWSADGKYLYFRTNRTEEFQPLESADMHIYRFPLKAYDEPFRSEKLDQLLKAEAENGDKKEATKVTVEIEPEDIWQRVEQLGPRFGSQGNLEVFKKGEKTYLLYQSNHDEGKPGLWKTVLEPFESPKTEKVGDVGNVDNFRMADGKFYALSNGDVYVLNLDANKTEKIGVKHTFRKNLRQEFEQMYAETWANLGENFYSESFHGRDWEALKGQYAAYLDCVRSRADLRRLLNDLMGELNTSHFGFYSSGKEESVFYKSTTLGTGIIYDNEAPYRVKRLVWGSPATKVGVSIQAGDRLIAVNGEAIDSRENRERYFSLPSMDEELALTFLRGTDTIRTRLHTVSSGAIRGLLYDEWERDKQQLVDRETNKEIAYIHMKDMGGSELDKFLQEMLSEGARREGLILDLRYNTGGNVHDAVLTFLAQKPYLKWKYREGALSVQSHVAPGNKPMVLLINEQSLSDAEVTAAGFRALDLGKIIGVETYRWIIFTSGKSLVDGSFYRLPSWGCYTLDGKNLEKTGVEPDIEIWNTFIHRYRGEDPQLRKAIEVVTGE